MKIKILKIKKKMIIDGYTLKEGDVLDITKTIKRELSIIINDCYDKPLKSKHKIFVDKVFLSSETVEIEMIYQ